MTKAQLFYFLQRFDDDQEIYVRLHSLDCPTGAQIAIQGVDTTPGLAWGGKEMVALVGHVSNWGVPNYPMGKGETWEQVSQQLAEAAGPEPVTFREFL